MARFATQRWLAVPFWLFLAGSLAFSLACTNGAMIKGFHWVSDSPHPYESALQTTVFLSDSAFSLRQLRFPLSEEMSNEVAYPTSETDSANHFVNDVSPMMRVEITNKSQLALLVPAPDGFIANWGKDVKFGNIVYAVGRRGSEQPLPSFNLTGRSLGVQSDSSRFFVLGPGGSKLIADSIMVLGEFWPEVIEAGEFWIAVRYQNYLWK